MKPLIHLHIQMGLEGKEVVNGNSMRQVETLPGEELPLVLVAQLSNAKLVVYYDQAISLDLQKELAASVPYIEFPNIDSLIQILNEHHVEFELGHYKTYLFSSLPSKVENILYLSKHDPKVKAFKFDSFAEQVYAIERDGILVSACVSARENEKCGEAWVYTDPTYRNQGFAQKVVNAWARGLMDAGKIPFIATRSKTQPPHTWQGNLSCNQSLKKLPSSKGRAKAYNPTKDPGERMIGMMNNRQLAEAFTLIADLLEIKGEIVYKTLAYRKAADSLLNLGREASEYWKEGKLEDIPGVGKAIAEKIDEFLSTGKLGFLEKLKKEVPPGLVEWLPIPGLGPKRAAMIWKALNITTFAELQAAAKEGKLRDLPGMGAKSEAAILEGIETLGRRTVRIPLGRALPIAQALMADFKKVKGVVDAQPGGSLRRMRDTVGDLDILVASDDPSAIMDMFVKMPRIHRVLGKGPTKASIEFNDGLRVQLWVHPPKEFGTAMIYATGSKEHNIRLREMALAKDLSLSDHSFKNILDGSEIFCATEEEVYEVLGLPWMPPEIREDRGEIQAAKANKLPKLIQKKDVKADLQMHSTWSDGKLSMLEMARASAKRGMKVIAFTDHSVSLGVTRGLSMEAHKEQAKEIKKIQKQLGDSILVLHASEVEIKADGTLDYPDEFLASLDLVVASLHTSLRQPREKVTQRVINAIRNPHVDIIGHPTGRLIQEREGADLDMEAVLKAAAESGVAMEINAHPARLDLDDIHARRAKDLGIPIALNTDAHSEEDLDMLPYGVATARRAWLTKNDVINCWSTDKLLKWLKKRGK